MSDVESTAQWDTDRVLTIPNVLSFLRLLSVIAFGWLILAGYDIAAVILLMVFGATDWLDGYLARRFNQRTELGAKLDPIADRLYILVALVTMLIRGMLPWPVVVILLARDLMLLCLVPMLRRRGVVALPVNQVGKAATMSLLLAFPLVLVGSPTSLDWSWAWWAGRVLLALGAMLYWWAGILYLAAARALPPARSELK